MRKPRVPTPSLPGLIRRLSHPFHAGHAQGYPEDGLSHESPAHTEQSKSTRYACTDYGPDGFEECEIDDIDAFFAKPRPDCTRVRWIRVTGTPNMKFLQALATRYHFHPLALEDLIQIPQRPKVDEYVHNGQHAYLAVIAAAPSLTADGIKSQQVTIFANRGLVVFFEEHDDGLIDRIRTRLAVPESRLRTSEGDFLLYCVIDQIIDRLFPILASIGDEVEVLDEAVIKDPDAKQMRRIHATKRYMMTLRREVWPMREMLQTLRTTSHTIITPDTQLYVRDAYDHCIHIVDMMETYRDAITSILDIHMNMMSNRMNEVMKVLTIIATIFIPLSFLSGVFGMNFTQSLPGQDSGWSFTIFAAGCITVGLTMLGLFWWKKWL